MGKSFWELVLATRLKRVGSEPRPPSLSFVVPGKPQGKQRARRGKGGHWYTPKETVTYENAVSAAALAAATAVDGYGRLYSGPVTLSVSCYFPDARRRDGDNVLKSVQDALRWFIYADDCQVRQATVTTQIDRDNPRTEVTVWYTDRIPQRQEE